MANKKSVKRNLRKKVGTVQIVLGLILFVFSILTSLIAIYSFDEGGAAFLDGVEDVNPYGVSWNSMTYFNDSSYDILTIGASEIASAHYNYLYFLQIKELIVLSTNFILLVLSLMFILNGLLNLN